MKPITKSNKEQAAFYDHKTTRKPNLFSKMWRYYRNNVLDQFRKDMDIKHDIYSLHREWLGDLEGKRILDLGCYSGNALSVDMASECGEYLGIDLSERGISQLQEKLNALKKDSAEARVIDFLSPSFQEKPFDIIYIYGAMHHFEDFEHLLVRLNSFLKQDGCIIAYDPLKTSILVNTVRALYRPFQQDAGWEWPFSKRTFKLIEKHFTIRQLQGVLGYSKYALIINLLPLSRRFKQKIGHKLHGLDKKYATGLNHNLWRCMQVATLLQKKDSAESGGSQLT
jgi:2-polyprenyl-3-methyl-5-hydroxy-6-metoxy-1,4-benzoquinol methylase